MSNASKHYLKSIIRMIGEIEDIQPDHGDINFFTDNAYLAWDNQNKQQLMFIHAQVGMTLQELKEGGENV